MPHMGDANNGLTPVYIGDVDDPATFWITPQRSFSDATVRAVMELEQKMSQYYQGVPALYTQPVVSGSRVAVLKESGSWVRGRVEHLVSTLDGDCASVFLVDWGHRLHNVHLEHVKPLPEELLHDLQATPQLAWKLVLKDVAGPGEANVLEVIKQLIRKSDGASLASEGLNNVGGNLVGDLYLYLPYDGEWKKFVQPSLLKLLEEYDNQLVHLNGMLNDLNFQHLIKYTSSGLSIAGPPPRQKVKNGAKLTSETGASISPKGRDLEGHVKSRKKKRKKRLTLFDYLADPTNSNGSYKMKGVSYSSFSNPNTSTPLNSSVENNRATANKPGVGRAARLEIMVVAPKIGSNSDNSTQARISDISPIEQYECAEESGNSENKVNKKAGSIIDSMIKISQGEISVTEQSTTFGTGMGGVQLMPGGAENLKQKKKLNEDDTFSEGRENVGPPSERCEKDLLQDKANLHFLGPIIVLPKVSHGKERGLLDNSWEPPRYDKYFKRASDDNSVDWGDRSESDKRGDTAGRAERIETGQLKNCVQPDERNVGGLLGSGLARNVTPSSQLTDSRFVPDSASSPSLNPSPELATQVAGQNATQPLHSSSSRLGKRIVFSLGTSQDGVDESESSDEYFSANETLEINENISSGRSAYDNSSIPKELNTAFNNDDKVSSNEISVSSFAEDLPHRTVGCIPTDVDETEHPSLTQDYIPPDVDVTESPANVDETELPVVVDQIESPVVVDETEPLSGIQDSLLPRDDLRNIDVGNQFKKSNLEILSVDPRSPSGFPRSPIIVNVEPEEVQCQNENKDVSSMQSEHKLIKFWGKQNKIALNNDEERSAKYEDPTTISQPVHANYEKQVNPPMFGRKFQERLLSREAWTRLLVHRAPKSQGGRACKLVDQVRDVSWCEELVRFLGQAGVTYSYIIQSALWPAVSRLISVVGIGGKGQGKTVGWALPLLSNLFDTTNYKALPPGKGPKAVVLVAGWKTARDIAAVMEYVSDKAKLQVAVAAVYAGREEELTATLINGVDVLVVTPSCLLRLVHDNRFTDLNRCCHFVVEEADRLLEWFPKEVESLMTTWKKVGLKLKGLPDQTIVVGERWSESVKLFVDRHRKDIGLIVFGSLLEGVIYGQLPIKPHFFKDMNLKMSRLLEILFGRGEKRVCICCSDADVGAELVFHLLQAGVQTLFIEERSENEERQDKLDDWRRDYRTPLIITDLALMFVVDPVPTDILVHWDLPKDSKKEFGIRFIMLKPAMKSFYGEANPMPGEFQYKDNNMDPVNACIYLMLTKEDGNMLKTIIHLLERNGTDIPQDLTCFNFGLKISRAKDAVLSGEPLCNELACRGVCRDNKLQRCNKRHFLHNEMDQPTEASSGVLNFLILFVESPVRYWVRILDPVMDSQYLSLMLKMGQHYKKESNRIMLKEENIEIGKTAVGRCKDGVYRRARILNKEYERTSTKHTLHKIELFLLDEGRKEDVDPGDVFQLTPELALEDFPPSAAVVVVAGLIPQDRDSDWSISAEMFVSNKLNLQSDDHDVKCRGRILLAIGNTFWINKCQLMVRQANIGTYICVFETREMLLESGHAVENFEHMEPLYQLADRAGIAKPSSESTVINSETPDAAEPRIAFLPKNESSLVYVSECYSPSLFYVTKAADVKRLNALERDMSAWAKEQGPVRLRWMPRTGDYVMARREQGGSWLRGKVVEKLGAQIEKDEDEGGDMWSWDNFKIFLVDSGEYEIVCLTDLAKIDQKFITRLPFQAIKCSLAFVKPAIKKSHEEIISPKEEAMDGDIDSTRENISEGFETAVKEYDFSNSSRKYPNHVLEASSVSTVDKMHEIDVDYDFEEDNVKWPSMAGDKFYELTRDPEIDSAEGLWCDVKSVAGNGSDRQYTICLLTESTGSDIGVALVNGGLAHSTYDISDELQLPSRFERELDPSEIQVDNAVGAQDELMTSLSDSGEKQECTGKNVNYQIEEMPEDFEMSLSPGLLKELIEAGQNAFESKDSSVDVVAKDSQETDDYKSSPKVEILDVKNDNSKEIKDPLPTPIPSAPLFASVHPADIPMADLTPLLSPLVRPAEMPVAASALPLTVMIHPEGMPVAAPVSDLSPVQTKKPAVVWSQDHNSLKINVTFDTMREPQLEQIYVHVDPGCISIQVSEPLKHPSGDEFILHTTGQLELHSRVHTGSSVFRVLGRRLVLTLRKRTECHWRQLAKKKMGWIKVDHDRLCSSDSDDERPGHGFMADFLKVAPSDEPKYDAVTGEQIMPEFMFADESDNELGSEDQDLDLVDDAGVDYGN